MNKQIEWIENLKQDVPLFLDKLKVDNVPGFFHYSLSGDLYDDNIKWGLGNTVFATKIYYSLDLLDKLPVKERKAMANFIKSFQQKDGSLYDPLVKRKTFLRDKLVGLRNLDYSNFFHKSTIRAETRQAISALNLLEEGPEIPYLEFPKTKERVETYLINLDWEKPWGAGSHFSHLMFFLQNSNVNNKSELINYSVDWVNKLQDPKSGSWYKNEPSLQQKINGAMKVITGLKVVNKLNFQYPDKLIDLCLAAKHNEQACDNFNIVYVLKYCNQISSEYKSSKIKEFAYDRLKIYHKYYYPKLGGFSFNQGQANTTYYDAKISRGQNEPDIHGTVMFLWGISIITQILEVNQKLGFKEFIT
ncbi:hypothetical protein KKB10_01200 [Patescibacteria group bacterium]|nr:hypothetical protein [Patescibacteria group bacterium]MBU1952085.1 hypothetical protein [Patescibacteria group bacterium]